MAHPKDPLPTPFTPFRPFTPVPTVLIDRIMPTLRDTEWRLLCVIVRQTIGWSTGSGQRKQRDWLTQSQLMKRTGRNSAALSAALDMLVRRRLVNAWDEAGNLLLTPQERRRYPGRIYFGLCPDVLQGEQPYSKSALHKAKRTKETTNERKNLDKEDCYENERMVRIYTGWMKASEVAAAHFTRE